MFYCNEMRSVISLIHLVMPLMAAGSTEMQRTRFLLSEIRASAQVTNIRTDVMAAEGEGLAKCSSESGGRVVFPAGRASGALAGWAGLPGVGAGEGHRWAV